MKALFWIACLLVGFLGCTHTITVPVTEFTGTAKLNNNDWYGTARAGRQAVEPGKPCTSDQFYLGISTDLPHPTSGTAPVGNYTGCAVKCIPTQDLTFYRIPLAVGRYKISDLQACIEGNDQAEVDYVLLIGGDGIIDSYYPQGIKIQRGRTLYTIPGTDAGWVEVTSYDQTNNQVEGKFELTLKNINGVEVRFTQGLFRVTLKS